MNEGLSLNDGVAGASQRITEPPPPEATSDQAAIDEAAEVASGKYDENESARTDQLRQHVHIAVLIAIWVALALVLIALFAISWHYLMPAKWAWLDTDQLTAIKTFIFSGAITGLGNRYLGSRLARDR